MERADALIHDLAKSLSGKLLLGGDDGYDEARSVHNGMIDKHPAVIVRCQGAADISAAIRFARANDLEIAVKGGGHGVAGRATVDDGLLIDLSGMKEMHVDPEARTIRAQGGVTWGEFYQETEAHGLSTNGGVVSSTGIAGLSLGGGIGYLMSRYGLTVDNMLEVEIVLADGSITRASSDENADLFWAVRGGGGNFGVAASLVYRLHEVGPELVGGLILYPFEQTRDLLRLHRDREAAASDDMVTFCGMIHGPDGSKLAAALVCHCGDPETAAAEVADLKSFGAPVLDEIGPIRFSTLNTLLDEGFPKGALNYWKSGFVSALSDEAIDVVVDCFERCPVSMSSVVLEHLTGAVCQVPSDACAWPHREEGFNVAIVGQWMDPADGEIVTDWTRTTATALAPLSDGRYYVNYLGDDESINVVGAAYGGNYEKLRQIKTKYDPDNVFHMNQNILPAEAD